MLLREQSSVMKQIEHLNESFQELCGEPLAIKRGRGEDYTLTRTCEQLVSMAEELFDEWAAYLEHRRREVGNHLIVATTTFTLRILSQIWEEVERSVDRRAELQVRQIHTRNFWDSLQDRSVDLVIGGIVAPHDKLPAIDYDFVEWSRETFCFLTNLPPRLFPGHSITWEELRRHPLILPEAGIIIDGVRTWYGEDFKGKLKLSPTVLDVHYARELLVTRMVEGFMVSTRIVASQLVGNAVVSESQSTSRTGSDGLRTIELGAGFQSLDIVSGLFGRKGERALYKSLDPRHPLVLFWEIFERHVAEKGMLLDRKRKT